jgi:hypothetical protein
MVDVIGIVGAGLGVSEGLTVDVARVGAGVLTCTGIAVSLPAHAVRTQAKRIRLQSSLFFITPSQGSALFVSLTLAIKGYPKSVQSGRFDSLLQSRNPGCPLWGEASGRDGKNLLMFLEKHSDVFGKT